MEKVRQYINNVSNTILEHIPYSTATDDVQIQIIRISDAYYYNFDTDVFVDTAITGTTGVMNNVPSTFGDIGIFKSSFIPTSNDTYSIITYNNTNATPYAIEGISTGVASSIGSSSSFAGSLSFFNAFAKVRERLGLAPYEAFPAELDDEDNEIISVMNDISIGTACNGRMWTPLEETGTITLVEGQTEYTKPIDMFKFDNKTFKHYTSLTDTSAYRMLKFYKRDGRNRYIDVTNSDIDFLWEAGGNFVLNKAPTAEEVGLTITYRYYKIPAEFDISKPNESSWFPTPFDREVLVEGTVAEMFIRRQKVNASTSYAKVYGDRTGIMSISGAIDRMAERYAVNQQTEIILRGM